MLNTQTWALTDKSPEAASVFRQEIPTHQVARAWKVSCKFTFIVISLHRFVYSRFKDYIAPNLNGLKMNFSVSGLPVCKKTNKTETSANACSFPLYVVSYFPPAAPAAERMSEPISKGHLECCTGKRQNNSDSCISQHQLLTLLCLLCRRRCQSPLQWHQASRQPRAHLWGEDGGKGPMGQQDRIYPVGGRLHHRPGQHVALPLPLLQERRRYVEDAMSVWWKV